MSLCILKWSERSSLTEHVALMEAESLMIIPTTEDRTANARL